MDLYKYQKQLARDGFNEEARTLGYLLTDADISIDKRQKLRNLEYTTLELIKDGSLPPMEEESMESMEFPNDIKDFIKNYSFKDKEERYTNGSMLIPVFRVEQMLEYYFGLKKEEVED